MARRNASELAFSALRIEGGLLPADELTRLTQLQDPARTEQSEAHYDIPKGLKLRDEIARYWKVAQTLWHDFQVGRARIDRDAYAVTIQEFLAPFCRQVLGFTDLKPVAQVTLRDRIFPIGFQALGGRIPLVLAAHTQDLDRAHERFGDHSGERVRRRSPFLLAQEYLNAQESSLWAIVSNGLRLRILRDNPSLTRPAYIEADIEAILTEGLYADFSALWLIAHATRFGKPDTAPADCPLERWRNAGQEAGVRARDRLRVGVASALRALGTGFISHPANITLRGKLDCGEISAGGLFEQLLRLVYRLIFLATAEDRRDQHGIPLVFASDASEVSRALYLEGYSLTRLRGLAAKRHYHDRHSDLWQALVITFGGFGRGEPALGLPALGGLFDADQCPDLDNAQLENRWLLSALFGLCFSRENDVLSRVNYRDMGPEELGSIYESLLELVPVVEVGSRHFAFVGDGAQGEGRGNARKLTGSYYTPDSLVQELIRSALNPVIERAFKDHPQDPVRALLSITICDPACGSGHFLLAAGRRLAEVLARYLAVQGATEGSHTQEGYRGALRDVVMHCLYGVDKNRMAIDLAKTALWLEAYAPDRPLNFLDHHLRVGDSLVGVLGPAVLSKGVPDQAFDALSGDDREVARELKKANRAARK